ncbi:hypothetical protein [Burkholderia orbicola]|uniref:hypothetical protein n=1 Tax=Burkholderia orbicola TaxID=2978683 RepID=UPI002FE3D8B0
MTVRFRRTPRVRLRPIEESSPEEVMADYPRLLQEHIALQALHKTLSREHEALKHKTIAHSGERYILELTSGNPQRYAAPFDVLSPSGHRLEVKSSRCRFVNQFESKSRRWTWSNLLGSSGEKQYDYAILLGEKDRDYLDAYPEGPYVIFCVPRERVNLLANDAGWLGCVTRLKGGATAGEMRRRWMVSPEWITNSFGDAGKKGINPIYPHT